MNKKKCNCLKNGFHLVNTSAQREIWEEILRRFYFFETFGAHAINVRSLITFWHGFYMASANNDKIQVSLIKEVTTYDILT